jgi:AcrR family transcriptional regulator
MSLASATEDALKSGSTSSPFAATNSLDSDADAKTKILHHACILLAKKGVKNTRVAEISEASGVSKPTIYNQFRDDDPVEKIYDTLIRRLLITLGAVIQVATEGFEPKDPNYWLQATIGFVKYFEANPLLAHLFFGPVENPRTRACPTIKETVYPILMQLLVERYGAERLTTPLAVTNQFGCSLLQLMHAYIHQIEQMSREQVVDLIMAAPAVPSQKGV